MSGPLPSESWRVYNYVAKNWYETEHGMFATRDRWYHPTMLRLEDLAYEHRAGSGRQ